MSLSTVALLVCVLTYTEAEEDLARTVRDGVQRVVAARGTAQFQCEDDRFNATTSPNEFVANARFNSDAEAKRFRWMKKVTADDGAVYETLIGVNESYGFIIQRQDRGDWTIVDIMSNLNHLSDMILGDELNSSSVSHFQYTLIPDDLIFIHRWDRLVSEPSFQILSSSTQGDERTIRFTLDGPMYKGNRVVQGEVTLDAELGLLRRYNAEVEFSSGERGWYEGETTYEGSQQGVPLVARHEYRDVDPTTGESVTAFRLTYSRVGPGDLKEREARLAAYGLPEPSRPAPQRLSAWVFFVGLGALCLTLAVWLRIRSSSSNSGE